MSSISVKRRLCAVVVLGAEDDDDEFGGTRKVRIGKEFFIFPLAIGYADVVVNHP